jgi:hypothetical protein
MSRVNAVTDGAGYRVWNGISLNNIRAAPVNGDTFNPWSKLRTLKNGRKYELWQFFAETDKETLVYKTLGDFNLLAAHARVQLDLDPFEKVTIYQLPFGANTRLLKAREMLFMMYAGKIYTQSLKKFKQEGVKDGLR